MLIPDQNGGAQCCHLARVNTEPATCLSRFLCQPWAGFNCLFRSEHERKLVGQVAVATVRLTSWWLATVLVMAVYAAREQGVMATQTLHLQQVRTISCSTVQFSFSTHFSQITIHNMDAQEKLVHPLVLKTDFPTKPTV